MSNERRDEIKGLVKRLNESTKVYSNDKKGKLVLDRKGTDDALKEGIGNLQTPENGWCYEFSEKSHRVIYRRLKKGEDVPERERYIDQPNMGVVVNGKLYAGKGKKK